MSIPKLLRFSLTPAVLLLSALAAAQFAPLPYEVDPDWPQLPAGRNFLEVSAVTVDDEGEVYVFHRGDDPITVFDKNGRFLRAFGNGLFSNPHGLKIDPQGFLWAVDNGSHMIFKLTRNGRVRMVLGRRGVSGESDKLFNRPADIAFGTNSDLYIADGYGNNRVAQFSADGTFIRSWGKRGVGEGEFNLPHGIAVDSRGRVLVADRENFRVQIFDAKGRYLDQWNHVGSPFGLALTDDGHVFIADGYHDRVVKTTLDGKIVGSLGGHGRSPGRFDVAHHLALGPAGDLFVAEIVTLRAQRFVHR
jgi:DNA-binding beta-propeller fold protein YncE